MFLMPKARTWNYVLSSSGILFTWTCAINFQSNVMLILFLNILPTKGKVLRVFFGFFLTFSPEERHRSSFTLLPERLVLVVLCRR